MISVWELSDFPHFNSKYISNMTACYDTDVGYVTAPRV